MHWGKKFNCVHKESGGIFIVFALSLLPLLTLMGTVVELSRQAYVITKLSYACDAAALAAVKSYPNDVQTVATQIFYANYPQGSDGITVTPQVTLSPDTQYVTVSVNSALSPFFNFFVSLPVSASAQAFRQVKNLEIALVLDVSGPMAGSNFTALRTIAKNLIQEIFGNSSTLNNVSVSIVPFAGTINVGPSRTGWIANANTLTSTFPSKAPWQGCVCAVDTGSTPDTDAPPSAARLWPFYYAPSSLLLSLLPMGNNDWSNVGGNVVVVTPLPNINVGPNRNCTPPILPLTQDKNTLLSYLNALTPTYGGGKFGNLGLVWGWNTLSPRWTNLWTPASNSPKPYANINQKVVVLITDGMNAWYNTSPPLSLLIQSLLLGTIGDPTSYGILQYGQLGTIFMSGVRNAVDTRVQSLCTAMKSQGIQLFTVTFPNSDASAKQLCRNCATAPSYAYTADNPQGLYAAIATMASQATGNFLITQ